MSHKTWKPPKRSGRQQSRLPAAKIYYLHPQRKTLRVVPREMPSRMTPAQELKLVWWLTSIGWQLTFQRYLNGLQIYRRKQEAVVLPEKE